MSMRSNWRIDGKHFSQTRTERGGERFFIDGKPTKRLEWLAERSAALASEKTKQEAAA
jgi:hypothetical protein